MNSLTVVIDIGKTLTKASLWTPGAELVARETRPNVRVDGGDYVALDVDGIDAWLGDVLAKFAQSGTIDRIVPVGHGAAAVLVRDGRVARAPIDYEERLSTRDEYEHGRAPFAQTGSPSLPDGLNLAGQLHELERIEPALCRDDVAILLWPQYWAWRLCGVMASEVTSLGCHTDLWNPATSSPSALAEARGWAKRLPPLRRAEDVLGTITDEWVRRTGLPTGVQVLCGIHDSNAALLAARGFDEIAGQEATVLSTGTWFVAMRTPGADQEVTPATLPEARDCLMNVDAYGRMVPSARFMGGREIELLTGLDTRRVDIKPDQPALLAACQDVLTSGARVLPTFAPGFGPYPDQRGRWVVMPDDNAARRSAVCLYAALVANRSLDLIGARDRILVEGRFAEAEVFVRALAALRPSDAIYRCHAHNDVSFGALRLIDPTLKPATKPERIQPLDRDIQAYARLWRRDAERGALAA